MGKEEIERVKEYLKENHQAPIDRKNSLELISHLENVYLVRDMDNEFWSRFLRLKAYFFNSMANGFRWEAIPLLEKRIKELGPGFDLIQHYFVLGDYYRRRGDLKKAVKFYTKAQKVKWTDDKGEKQVGSEYINDLIDGRMLEIREGFELIGHYFSLGEYERYKGNYSQARKYYVKAENIRWVDENNKVHTGNKQINKLIKDRRKKIVDQF